MEKSLFLVFLLALSLAHVSWATVTIECEDNAYIGCPKCVCNEGGSVDLSCPSGYGINIVSANWGRQSSEVCTSCDFPTASTCIESGTQAIVEAACQDQASCSVLPRNDLFGDPCPGTYKYLEVEWECVVQCEGVTNGQIAVGQPAQFVEFLEIDGTPTVVDGKVLDGKVAYRAVDGRISLGPLACTATTEQANNFLRIELPNIVRIASVSVWTPESMTATLQAQFARVQNAFSPCVSDGTPVASEGLQQEQFSCGDQYARWIQVGSEVVTSLELCEVQVFATEEGVIQDSVSRISGPEVLYIPQPIQVTTGRLLPANLDYAVPLVTPSLACDSSDSFFEDPLLFTCDLAINGVVQQAITPTTDGYHSAGSGVGAWMWIDLGSTAKNYLVTGVVIHPQACCQARTEGRYRFCDTPTCAAGEPNTFVSAGLSGIGIEGFEYVLSPPVIAKRYFRVDGGETDYLVISEIQINGIADRRTILAKDGAITPPMVIVDDDYVVVPDPPSIGERFYTDDASSAIGKVSFSLRALSDTTVTLEAEVLTPTSGKDSFHVWMDDVADSKIWFTGDRTTFETIPVGAQTPTGTPFSFELTAGIHTLVFAHREPASQLRSVRIVTGDAFVPPPANLEEFPADDWKIATGNSNGLLGFEAFVFSISKSWLQIDLLEARRVVGFAAQCALPGCTTKLALLSTANLPPALLLEFDTSDLLDGDVHRYLFPDGVIETRYVRFEALECNADQDCELNVGLLLEDEPQNLPVPRAVAVLTGCVDGVLLRIVTGTDQLSDGFLGVKYLEDGIEKTLLEERFYDYEEVVFDGCLRFDSLILSSATVGSGTAWIGYITYSVDGETYKEFDCDDCTLGVDQALTCFKNSVSCIGNDARSCLGTGVEGEEKECSFEVQEGDESLSFTSPDLLQPFAASTAACQTVRIKTYNNADVPYAQGNIGVEVDTGSGFTILVAPASFASDSLVYEACIDTPFQLRVKNTNGDGWIGTITGDGDRLPCTEGCFPNTASTIYPGSFIAKNVAGYGTAEQVCGGDKSDFCILTSTNNPSVEVAETGTSVLGLNVQCTGSPAELLCPKTFKVEFIALGETAYAEVDDGYVWTNPNAAAGVNLAARRDNLFFAKFSAPLLATKLRIVPVTCIDDDFEDVAICEGRFSYVLAAPFNLATGRPVEVVEVASVARLNGAPAQVCNDCVCGGYSGPICERDGTVPNCETTCCDGSSIVNGVCTSAWSFETVGPSGTFCEVLPTDAEVVQELNAFTLEECRDLCASDPNCGVFTFLSNLACVAGEGAKPDGSRCSFRASCDTTATTSCDSTENIALGVHVTEKKVPTVTPSAAINPLVLHRVVDGFPYLASSSTSNGQCVKLVGTLDPVAAPVQIDMEREVYVTSVVVTGRARLERSQNLAFFPQNLAFSASTKDSAGVQSLCEGGEFAELQPTVLESYFVPVASTWGQFCTTIPDVRVNKKNVFQTLEACRDGCAADADCGVFTYIENLGCVANGGDTAVGGTWCYFFAGCEEVRTTGCAYSEDGIYMTEKKVDLVAFTGTVTCSAAAQSRSVEIEIIGQNAEPLELCEVEVYGSVRSVCESPLNPNCGKASQYYDVVNDQCMVCGSWEEPEVVPFVGQVANRRHDGCETCPVGTFKAQAGDDKEDASCLFPGDEGFECGPAAGPAEVLSIEVTDRMFGDTILVAPCLLAVCLVEPPFPGEGLMLNKYAADGVCKLCPQGQVARMDRTACEFCPVGTIKITDDTQNEAYCADYNTADFSCGTAEYANEGVCEKCPVGHVASTDWTSCVPCPNGQVRFPQIFGEKDGVCVGPNVLCCGEGCGMCLTASVCGMCESAYVKALDGTCVTICPSSQYLPLASETECAACPSNCVTCTDDACQECAAGYTITSLGTACVNECPVGEFETTNGYGAAMCQTCEADCSRCTSATDCQLCTSPTHLLVASGGDCVSQCPSGEFGDPTTDTQCTACPEGCDDCDDSTSCNSCAGPLAIQSCSVTYVGGCNEQAEKLINSFEGYTVTECALLCQGTLACGGFFYGTSGPVLNKCFLVKPGCTQDTGRTNAEYYDLSTCSVTAPSPQLSCTKTWAAGGCTEQASLLISNNEGPVSSISYNQFQCARLCEVTKDCGGFFLGISGAPTGKCFIVKSGCTQDSRATVDYYDYSTCSPAANPLLLTADADRCLDACPVGEWQSGNSACSTCSDNCLDCDDGTTCNQCAATHIVKNGYGTPCVTSCGNGYYGTVGVDLECAACLEDCETCSDGESCTECEGDDFVTAAGTGCVATCPTGEYLPADAIQCVSCLPSCDICSDDSTCSECQSSHYLRNGNECVIECGNGYYVSQVDPNECSPCTVGNCDECASDTCTKCIEGKILNAAGDTCVDSCGLGEFGQVCEDPDTYQCKECFVGCDVCDSETTCLRCASGIVSADGSSCGPSCATGEFGVVGTDDQCGFCLDNCDSCSDQSSCITCAEDVSADEEGGYYLSKDADFCFKTCPNRFYADSSDQCADCLAGCKDCTEAALCTQCVSGMILNVAQSACAISCPAGEYDPSDGAPRQCETCLANCASCTDGETCNACESPNYLSVDADSCDPSCAAGSVLANAGDTQCTACLDNCAACTSPSACDTCNEGFLISLAAACVEECPAGSYDGGEGYCLACPDGCDVCEERVDRKSGLTYLYCTKCASDRLFDYKSSDCVAECSDDRRCGTAGVHERCCKCNRDDSPKINEEGDCDDDNDNDDDDDNDAPGGKGKRRRRRRHATTSRVTTRVPERVPTIEKAAQPRVGVKSTTTKLPAFVLTKVDRWERFAARHARNDSEKVTLRRSHVKPVKHTLRSQGNSGTKRQRDGYPTTPTTPTTPTVDLQCGDPNTIFPCTGVSQYASGGVCRICPEGKVSTLDKTGCESCPPGQVRVAPVDEAVCPCGAYDPCPCPTGSVESVESVVLLDPTALASPGPVRLSSGGPDDICQASTYSAGLSTIDVYCAGAGEVARNGRCELCLEPGTVSNSAPLSVGYGVTHDQGGYGIPLSQVGGVIQAYPGTTAPTKAGDVFWFENHIQMVIPVIALGDDPAAPATANSVCLPCRRNHYRYPREASRDASCVPFSSTNFGCTGNSEVAFLGRCIICPPGAVYAITMPVCQACPEGEARFPQDPSRDATCVAYSDPDFPCLESQVVVLGVCQNCPIGQVRSATNTCEVPAGLTALKAISFSAIAGAGLAMVYVGYAYLKKKRAGQGAPASVGFREEVEVDREAADMEVDAVDWEVDAESVGAWNKCDIDEAVDAEDADV